MRVVCTAGHVDHGKSTLVKALTGMEPDRFEEERRRGLTIDLGFAWTELAAGADEPQTVAFVDLPGHERFVGNMLAGAGGVDFALFVVAADEGWMPQSQEHLDILDLLGVSHGLVVVTKADTVDAETLEMACELAREELAGTAFADVEVLGVSAVTGMGMDALREHLSAALAQAPGPRDRGRPRLWVDRSFSITGAGTVVTGTLQGGRLRTGDELVVLPGGRRGRVRGLQRLEVGVDEAGPGSRVAVNLSGTDRADVRRGTVLARAGDWLETTAVDAWVRALPGSEIDRRGAWHLHAGSGEWPVRVAPLRNEPLRADAPGHVRVELDRAAPLAAGDRFVLREAGRRATLGGGVVLDADPPPRPKGSAARRLRAAQLDRRREALSVGEAAGTAAADGAGAGEAAGVGAVAGVADGVERLVGLHVAERGAADASRTAAALGASRAGVEAAARAAGLVPLGAALADPGAVRRWGEAAAAALRGYHAAHPVERAAPKDVAVRSLTAAGCPSGLTAALLDRLVADGIVATEGAGLRAPDHTVVLTDADSRAREALLAALGAEPFAPPNLAEAADTAGASVALVRELEAAGEIVRLATDLAVRADALVQAHARLAEAFRNEGPLTAARAKDVLGTSRKFALPLLEELDRRGHTRRVGDAREVR